MSIRRIFQYLGRILTVCSLIELLPVISAVAFGEYECIMDFVIPATALGALSLVMYLGGEKGRLLPREGFVIVSLAWILISLFGAAPFMLGGYIPRFADAFFETVSGFTTTGASILADVESLPKSMLFWRSFTHWVGGMGVLAFAIALLPRDKRKSSEGGSAVHIISAESPGPIYGKVVSKLKYNVQILYIIYFVLTVVEIVLLRAGGMPLFDSLLNSFGTAGTGGFAIKNASIAAYDSVYAEMVIGIFMTLFGINFNVFYMILAGRVLKALKSEELRWYLGIMAAAVAAIAVNIYSIYGSIGAALRYSFFQVSSIMTTTGFSTADFDMWPTFSKAVLVLLMFIGASAGSTGGGIKVSRVIILVKTAFKEIRYRINPREVRVVRCDDEVMEQSVVTGVSSYFVVYMILFGISTLVLCCDSLGTTDAFTSVAACFNNIGPGLGAVGPTQNYSALTDLSKYVLSVDMLLGRLEIFPLLVLFAPPSWRK